MSKIVKVATADGSLELFDERPIELPGFQLRARSVRVVGKPGVNQIINALTFAQAAEQASPYWIGDILQHVEARADLTDKIDQIVSLTGLARQTIHNRTYIARHVEEPERKLAPSLAHASQVAALERPQQTKLLEQARSKEWTVRELQAAVRQVRRPKVLEGQAVLEGMYRVIYAAPDWSRLTVQEIAALPVQAHAAAEAVLLMWVPPRLMLADPGPREVLKAWGFDYKTHGVWDRVLEGFGDYFAMTHEDLVLATRGNCQPDAPDYRPKSVYTERRQPERVDKPKEIRRQIERMYQRGPYLELFGLEAVDGWSVFGQDPARWAEQAAEEAATA